MNILIACTYYHPHVSGVSMSAKNLAEELVRLGHAATVACSQSEPHTLLAETLEGVAVRRSRVWGRLGRGVVSPGLIRLVWRLAREHDVVCLQLPMGEAGPIACRIPRDKMVLTYHCDLDLPRWRMEAAVERVAALSMSCAARAARAIVCTSREYAESSPFASRHLHKCSFIPPAINAKLFEAAAPSFRKDRGEVLVGFVGRFGHEKGIDVLLETIPEVSRVFPRACYLLTGEHQHVAGGSLWPALFPLLERHRDRIRLVGPLPNACLAPFYSSLDVLVVPSVNRMEAYGMVQVEAMLCGTPVVASDLPGVRQVIGRTGMGICVPMSDRAKLARAICTVIRDRPAFVRPRAFVLERLRTESVASDYLELFHRIAA